MFRHIVKQLRLIPGREYRHGSTAVLPQAEAEARMWAWQSHSYGPLSELRLERARIPRVSAPDEMLVQVHTASINPLDRAMIGGYGSRILRVLRGCELEFPLVVGRDVCGVVMCAGSQAGAAPGDRVWGVIPPHASGGLAQYAVLRRTWAGPAPADTNAVALVFAGLSAAAALSAAGLRWGAADAAADKRVLLLGVGGVGVVALQVLKHAGATVTVVCGAGSSTAATDRGANHVILRDEPKLRDLIVEHGPYDVALDCAGLGGREAALLAAGTRTVVTLTSPLLSLTDAHGLLPGTAAAGAELARQQRDCATRWAYCMPDAEVLRVLGRLSDAGQLRARAVSVPWRMANEAVRAGRGAGGEQLVVDFRDDAAESTHLS